MQNAQSGHTLLSNDFKLKHNVLIGVNTEVYFSIESLLQLFEDPENILFDLVCLKRIDEIENGVEDEKCQNLIGQFTAHGLSANFLKFNLKGPELSEQSVIYDAFCMPKEMLHNGDREQTVFSFNCPLLLINDQIGPLEKVILLFDGTPECLIGLKQFIKLFYRWIQSASVTMFMLRDQDDDYIYKEKVMVDYLLSNFIDVGVIASEHDRLEQDMCRHIEGAKHPIFLTGMYGAKSVFKRNLCNLITDQTPLFISLD